MFIVQTYFSDDIAGSAKAYVYYVELPGNPINLRNVVVDSFRNLGDEYGDDVSLFFPDLDSVSKIRLEIKRELGDIFGIRSNQTPCLIVSPTKIDNTAGRDDWIFFSLRDRPEISRDEVSAAVRDCIEAILAGSTAKKASFLKRFWRAVEAKPGLGGFRLDLKKLFGAEG